MSSVRYYKLLLDISKKLDELKNIEGLKYMCKGKISPDNQNNIDSARALFDELEEQSHLGIDCLDDLKEMLKELREWELLQKVLEFENTREEVKKLEEERHRMEGKATRVLSSAKRAGEKMLGAINLHCNFRTISGGVVVVGTAVILRKCSTLPEFMDAFTKVVLPAATKLCAITEGSVCFTVQAENRSALQVLWQQYQDGTLQRKLQYFLITEEINQLADGQEVMVNVNIVEQEYKEACLELMTAEMEVFDKEPPRPRRQRESDSIQVFEKEPLRPRRQRESDSIQVFDKEPPRPRRQKESDSIQGPSSDPSRSVAEGKGLKEAEVGRETNFTIETRNSEGKQFSQADDHVTVKIPTPKDEEMEKKIENNKDGREYTATNTPDSVGQHETAINVNDQPLTGSPWSVQVTPHKYETESTFGSRGKGKGQFRWPQGIAVSEKTGNIAVADTNNNRIQIFSSEKKYLRKFGQKWIGADILSNPRSVAFTRSGDVIVVHSAMISVFTEDGKLIKHVINEYLEHPLKVSVGRDGHLIVCEYKRKAIKVLSPDGTELLQWLSASDCDECPYFAVYHQDTFFVSYDSAHCVKVFNKEGVLLYNIGSEGPGEGQLKCPRGLAVDKFNNLIVCDYNNNRLQVFTLEGQFVSKTDQHTPRLVRPESVAVSQDGHVFVTHGSTSTDSVHVLK